MMGCSRISFIWVRMVNLLLVRYSQGSSYIKLLCKKILIFFFFFFCKFLCLIYLMIYVCLNRTNPWLELSIKFHQYSVGAFHKALVELNNLWIHLVLKEFNWASMSKIPSSPFQMETSTRSLRGLFFFVVTEEFVSSFLIFSLIFFIIVDIGPMYHSFDERIWFTFIFSLSKRVTLVPIFFFFFFFLVWCERLLIFGNLK